MNSEQFTEEERQFFENVAALADGDTAPQAAVLLLGHIAGELTLIRKALQRIRRKG